MRSLSETGRQQLKQLEGCRLRSYADSAGCLTIGYGHTSKMGEPMVYKDMEISQEQAEEIFIRDLRVFEMGVERMVLSELSQNQFDALVMFCYNVGLQNFARSRLLHLINQGDFQLVPHEMMRWVNSSGKFCEGLARRRNAEIEWWFGGDRHVHYKHMPPIRPSDNRARDKAGWLRHIVALIAPLGGTISVISDMIAHAPALQIALSILIVPSAIMGFYYYWHHM